MPFVSHGLRRGPKDAAATRLREWHMATKTLLTIEAVWVFYAKTREVQVVRADGGSFVRRESETLVEPGLLPGFSLDLKAVF